MLFTVFQYAPILEEEAHISKTLDKKCDDSSPENDTDDSTDSDSDDDINEFCSHDHFNSITLCSSLHKFHDSHSYLLNSLISISTPPPKV
jgi:hypothetical protein